MAIPSCLLACFVLLNKCPLETKIVIVSFYYLFVRFLLILLLIPLLIWNFCAIFILYSGRKHIGRNQPFTCADFCVNQKEKSSMETELWHKWGYHHSYSGFVLSGTFMLISTQNFILLVVFFVPHLLLNIIRQSTVKN